MSSTATRMMPPTGVSQRSSSSTADGTSDGSATSCRALLGVLAQVAEEAVERRAHGVEAGDEEEEADVEDVLAA